MKSRTVKVVGIFLVMGLASGLLSIFIGSLFAAWMWFGIGAILLLELLISIIIASQLNWLSLTLSVRRSLSAALIMVTAYPISVFVMIGSALLYGRLYAAVFSERWQERYYSGDDPAVNEGVIAGLYPAAIVGAVLVSVALKVLISRWDKQAMLLLVLAGIVTIPLSQVIASLLSEPNWHLVLFPVGEALFSALCGYWLLRVSPVEEQGVSSSAPATQSHQRPA
jgi:hypothetical protein